MKKIAGSTVAVALSITLSALAVVGARQMYRELSRWSVETPPTIVVNETRIVRSPYGYSTTTGQETEIDLNEVVVSAH